MEQTTLCTDCEFAERVELLPSETDRSAYALSHRFRSGISDHCQCEDAPISDYVNGFRNCATINKGHCQFFQPLKGEKRRHVEKRKRITEEEYKEIDSKLQSVIETLHYLVTCNQEQPEGITCYYAHSLDEPINILNDAKEILAEGKPWATQLYESC